AAGPGTPPPEPPLRRAVSPQASLAPLPGRRVTVDRSGSIARLPGAAPGSKMGKIDEPNGREHGGAGERPRAAASPPRRPGAPSTAMQSDPALATAFSVRCADARG